MSFKGMITLLLCAGLAGPALAQDPVLDADEGCGTKLRLEDVPLIRLREALGLYAEPRAMAAQEYTIPLTIHVVRRTNGTEGLAQDRIDQAIADANEIWAPAEMQFCQWGPTRYVDDDEFWWYLDDFEGFVLRTIDVVPNTVNVYFAPSMGPCGRASFTHSGTQGILIANGCAGTDRNPSTFGHELGHYFDLYHTHETGFGVECADGSNCATAGDLLCDTAADPKLSDLVFPPCDYIGPTDGPCPDDAEYDPDTHNLMSYSIKRCRDFLSPEQIARARATLVNLRPELLDLGDCAGPASCGAGAGDCYAANGTPGCEDAFCCALVCSVDDFCCTTQWDGICADEAGNLCVTGDECDRPIEVSEGVVPVVTLVDNSGFVDDSSCATGDEIDEWYNYTASCGGQATAFICTEFTAVDITLSIFDACNGNEIACSHDDPDCSLGTDFNARVSWMATGGETYAIRVSAVDATPGNNFTGDLVVNVACCGSAAAGNCFVANGTPFCDKRACCEAVCAVDAYCCTVQWDATCAAQAQSMCMTCGGAGAGGCFVANGTPACERTDCCNLVCAADAYCCDTNWDALCADEAYEFCSLMAFDRSHVPLGDADLTPIPGGDVWVHPIGTGGDDGVAILAGGLPAVAGDPAPVTSA
ncbi:MAG: zinc metalloprotease, partial [Planctomycetota bacterium]